MRSAFALVYLVVRHATSICLLTFFMYSVVLLICANPKGDIQDAFIQRVKWIPSYALWSILAGYGVVMALAGLRRLAQGRSEKQN